MHTTLSRKILLAWSISSRRTTADEYSDSTQPALPLFPLVSTSRGFFTGTRSALSLQPWRTAASTWASAPQYLSSPITPSTPLRIILLLLLGFTFHFGFRITDMLRRRPTTSSVNRATRTCSCSIASATAFSRNSITILKHLISRRLPLRDTVCLNWTQSLMEHAYGTLI